MKLSDCGTLVHKMLHICFGMVVVNECFMMKMMMMMLFVLVCDDFVRLILYLLWPEDLSSECSCSQF